MRKIYNLIKNNYKEHFIFWIIFILLGILTVSVKNKIFALFVTILILALDSESYENMLDIKLNDKAKMIISKLKFSWPVVVVAATINKTIVDYNIRTSLKIPKEGVEGIFYKLGGYSIGTFLWWVFLMFIFLKILDAISEKFKLRE